jgi:hypothetical protein
MIRPFSLVVATVLLATSKAFADLEQSHLYTRTHGASCIDRSRSQFGAWRCSGPDGYVAEYFDEGNVAGIAIWNPVRSRTAQVRVQWRGAGKTFGELLEWDFRDGQPSVAILRTWRLTTTSEGLEREVEELIVLKLQPHGACRIASVSARQSEANFRAQQIAEQAFSLPCLENDDS